MVALGKDVQFALYAHGTHLLPGLDGVHGCPAVLIAVDKKHRHGLEVEVKLRHKDGAVVCSAGRIVLLCTIGQGIGGIDADAPLHVAGLLVEVVDGQIGLLHGRGDAHQGKMSAGTAAHDADVVRVKTKVGRLALDDANGTLQVLPGGNVLLQARLGSRSGRTITHRHDSHAQAVEVATGRSHLESVGAVAHVAAAGIDDLYGLRLEIGRDVPFDIRRALICLRIRHLAVGPDVLLDILRTVVVIVEALHDFHFGSKRREQQAHLLQELDAAFQAKGTVPLAGIEMQLGIDFPLAQLAEHHRRGVGAVGVVAAMMQAHGAGLLVEMKDGVELDVRTVAETHVGRAAFAVAEHVCRSVDDGEVHVTGDVVQRVDRSVGTCHGARSKQQCKVRPCRHADGANLLRVETSLLRFASHHADGSLAVLPSCLIDGQPLGPRCAIDKVDALEAKFREALRPKRNEVVVASAVVSAARDENHAAAVRRFGLFHPLQVGHAALVGIEALLTCLGGHGSNLLRLCIGHLAFRPNGNVLCLGCPLGVER